MQAAWVLSIALLGLFVVLSQSRGVALALLLTPVWCRGHRIGPAGAAAVCELWFGVLWQAWKARDTLYGKGIIGMWVFSFLAMQFDAASLTGTPRAEWFISWLPIALASVLVWARAKPDACDKVRVLSKQ